MKPRDQCRCGAKPGVCSAGRAVIWGVLLRDVGGAGACSLEISIIWGMLSRDQCRCGRGIIWSMLPRDQGGAFIWGMQ